jgi:glycosyltransferase involved in cell wall biosynthesis
MPASYLLLSRPAALGWSIGPLVIRGDDVYAAIGLVAGLLLLTLWVLLENFRLTRWRPNPARLIDWSGQRDASEGSPASSASAPAITPAPAATPPPVQRRRAVGEPDMTPVAARAEWLLDDNTLVRTGAVRRGAVRPVAAAPLAGGAPVAPVAPSEPDAPIAAKPKMKAKRPLHIAMMGSRGIPASYSGFETCVEQLSVRLVERGHHVTVYCRSHHIKWPEKTYKGVRLVKLPTIASKHLDTIAHTFLSMLHGEFRRYDVVYICGVGNGPLAAIPRLAGKPTAINVDGADWERDKWGGFAKRYLQFSERMATRLASCIVSDSHVVERYYQEKFRTPSVFVPYGSDVPHLPPGETLARLGLQPNGYILWVGRLVPENNAHDVIEAYQRLGGPATGLQLCLIGDAPYSSDYKAELKQKAGPGVVFAGYVFGDGYHELGSNARIYAFASGVGGTHPALLEAMAFGNCVVVNDMAANMETVGDAALPYSGAEGATDLARVMAQAIADPALVEEYRKRAAHRAATVYSWEVVTDQYEDLFSQLARN